MTGVMSKTFSVIMDGIHESEGGYVNHPRDPGGATNMGITQRTLVWARKVLPGPFPTHVRNLTKEQANWIYKELYWDPIKGNELPAGVDYITMDAAVNSGVKRGSQWTQRAAGVRQVDGIIGPNSLAMIHRADPTYLIETAADIRRGFLQGLRTFDVFGKGWMRRVARVEAKSLKLAEANITQVMDRAFGRVAQAKKNVQNTGVGTAIGGTGGAVIEGVPDWLVLGAVGVMVVFLIMIVIPKLRAEKIRMEEFEKELIG